MALPSGLLARIRRGGRRAAPAGRRSSAACQLLACAAYLVLTRHSELLSAVFVSPPRSQASRPLPQATARGATAASVEVKDKASPDEDEDEPTTVEEVLNGPRGDGPFGIKYSRKKSNVPILAGLALFAGLLVCRQDIITILALYEYGAGDEMSWSQASIMVLARLPLDAVTSYGEASLVNPVFVKAATSGVAYFAGDILAQIFEGRIKFEWLDLSRCARNAAAGFFLHGPLLHFWIEFLEGPFSEFLGVREENKGEYWVIAAKIFVDQTAFALVLSALYAVFVGFLAAKPADEVMKRAADTIPPSMVSSWRFWPFVHLITYAPFMPIEFKVLWNDVAEIAWVAILSVIANNDRDDNPDQQLLVVTEDFGVDPASEIALVASREKMAGLGKAA